MTDAINIVGTADPPGTHEVTPGSLWGSYCEILIFLFFLCSILRIIVFPAVRFPSSI